MDILKKINDFVDYIDEKTGKVQKGTNVVFTMALCSNKGKPILFRFQHEDYKLWYLTSSVQIKEELLAGEVNVNKKISGAIGTDPNYSGCPYCHSVGFAKCNCGKLCCWNFKDNKPVPVQFQCPWCWKKGVLGGYIKSVKTSRGY